jgi:hypothetical protein
VACIKEEQGCPEWGHDILQFLNEENCHPTTSWLGKSTSKPPATRWSMKFYTKEDTLFLYSSACPRTRPPMYLEKSMKVYVVVTREEEC